MQVIKKYKTLLIVALVLVAGIFFFFFHLYNNDVKVLTDFSVSYKKFDIAISDFSIGKTASDNKASNALVELNTKANFRISSLIKNDGELMNQVRQIADISRQELESLKIYKNAIQNKNTDLDGLSQAYKVLSSERKAAFARFQELAEIKD